MWFDFVVQHIPENEYWRVDSKRVKIGPGPDGGLLEKINWAQSLWLTKRGIGWNWRVGGVTRPVAADYSRLLGLSS